MTTSFLETNGHIFCGVYIEFKDIMELSWCGVIGSTPHKQANTMFIIIRYAFGDIRYLNIVDILRACFSLNSWCFSFHFS